MRMIPAEPLCPESFLPFGQVLESPTECSRAFYNEAIENARVNAKVNLSIASITPLSKFPFEIQQMERHPWSSQTFIPMKVSRYLIIVAPDGTEGEPNMDEARAFLASGGQAITYRRAVWHHGMTVLDETATMAVLMWCDGGNGDGDEEFVDIIPPFNVGLPDLSNDWGPHMKDGE